MRLYIFEEYNIFVEVLRCETGFLFVLRISLYTGGALFQGLLAGALDQGEYILALSDDRAIGSLQKKIQPTTSPNKHWQVPDHVNGSHSIYRSGSSRCINRVQVLSFHHSSILSIRSHKLSSSTP